MKLLFIIFIAIPVYAISQDTIRLSYHEKLNFQSLENDYRFKITSIDFIAEIDQSQLNTFSFPHPGVYTIETTRKEDNNHHEHNEECNHNLFPNRFYVLLDSVDIQFHASSLRTSKSIVKNNETKGNVLFIDVDIISWNDKTVKMPLDTVYSHGIGTQITGILDPQSYYLKPGRHTLQYNLSGICTMDSYIQFDFVKHNGTLVPVPLPHPVKRE